MYGTELRRVDKGKEEGRNTLGKYVHQATAARRCVRRVQARDDTKSTTCKRPNSFIYGWESLGGVLRWLVPFDTGNNLLYEVCVLLCRAEVTVTKIFVIHLFLPWCAIATCVH